MRRAICWSLVAVGVSYCLWNIWAIVTWPEGISLSWFSAFMGLVFWPGVAVIVGLRIRRGGKAHAY